MFLWKRRRLSAGDVLTKNDGLFCFVPRKISGPSFLTLWKVNGQGALKLQNVIKDKNRTCSNLPKPTPNQRRNLKKKTPPENNKKKHPTPPESDKKKTPHTARKGQKKTPHTPRPERKTRVILACMCVKLQMRSHVCHRVGPLLVHDGSIAGPFRVHFGFQELVFGQKSVLTQ